MASQKRVKKREGQALRRAALEATRKKEANKKRLWRVGALVLGVVVIAGLSYLFWRWQNQGESTITPTTVAQSAPTSDSPATSGGPVTTAKSAAAEAPPDGKTITGDTPCPKADGSSERTTKFEKAPPMCIKLDKSYSAAIETDVGTYKVALDAKKAPKTVNNFVVLSRYHYYDGVPFHRVIPGFMNQGGDITATGAGGPGYTFEDELPKKGEYKVGSLAMANSGPNTNGSQFFTITGDQGVDLQPKYSLFGQVTDGMDVVKKIEADGSETGTPKTVHKMVKVTITES